MNDSRLAQTNWRLIDSWRSCRTNEEPSRCFQNQLDWHGFAARIVQFSKERGTSDNVSVVSAGVIPTRDYSLTTAPTATLAEREWSPVVIIAAIVILAILGLIGFLAFF